MALVCRMSEAPFRPREKLFEKQKYFQNIPKHTYLKGPMDKVTSVAIPLALAASSIYLIVSLFVIWSFLLVSVDFVISMSPILHLFGIILYRHCVMHFVQGRGIYNMSHGIGKKE